MDEELINRRVARRRLLAKAGTVAATVAGAGAVSAAIASPAEAAPGQNLVIGQVNDGGTVTTALDNASVSNATLALANDGTATVSGLKKAGAPLTLVPNGDYVLGPVGSLGVSTDGTLWSTGNDPASGAFADFVRTGSNSTIVYPFAPVRMLETRPEQAGGKAGILNPSVLNAQGFLPAGQTLHLSLDSLLVWGWAVFANITVIAGGQTGYLAAYPSGTPLPLASNVNFTPGQVVANFAAIGVGTYGSPPAAGSALNAISIYVNAPAKVIIDIAGAVVNYPSDIKRGGAGVAPESGGVPRPGAPRVRPANV